jgi:hypothetical protein
VTSGPRLYPKTSGLPEPDEASAAGLREAFSRAKGKTAGMAKEMLKPEEAF